MMNEGLKNVTVYATTDVLPSHEHGQVHTNAWDLCCPTETIESLTTATSYPSLIDGISVNSINLDCFKRPDVKLDDILRNEFGEELEKKLVGKKEGKNMELLDLFEEKSAETIEDFFDGLIEEEHKNHPITKAYKEFIAKYSEENAEKNNGYIAEILLTPVTNSDKITWLKQQKDEWAFSLQEIVNEVSAHLDLIDDDYDTIINVLKNYNVLDEKGKVTPLTPYIDDTEFEEYLKEQKKENQ